MGACVSAAQEGVSPASGYTPTRQVAISRGSDDDEEDCDAESVAVGPEDKRMVHLRLRRADVDEQPVLPVVVPAGAQEWRVCSILTAAVASAASMSPMSI